MVIFFGKILQIKLRFFGRRQKRNNRYSQIIVDSGDDGAPGWSQGGGGGGWMNHLWLRRECFSLQSSAVFFPSFLTI